MSNPYIEEAEEAILHTYNRYQIVLDRGEGVHLYDVNGKEYLDFAAGIAVQSLGYNNKEYTQALKDQIDKLTHISNLYYSVPMAEAAEKVKKPADWKKYFSPTAAPKPLRVRSKWQENIPMQNTVRTAMRSLP